MCGQCQLMLTAQESVCCQEVEKVRDLLVGDPALVCITLHTDFAKAPLQSCTFNCLSLSPTPLWDWLYAS